MSRYKERSLIQHPMAKWGLFLGLLFVLWFGGWFAFARYADGKIGAAIVNYDQRGIKVDCENREMRGFPFRIGVNCDAVNISHKRDVFRIEMGALRTAAQLYAPGEMIVEVDGPFESWPGGRKLTADWTMMRAFIDGKLNSGFDLASLNFARFNAQIGNDRIAVDEGAIFFRPAPPANEGDQPYRSLDLAFDIIGLKASNSQTQFPPARVVFDGTLVDGYQDMIVGRQPIRSIMNDGAEFVIRRLTISFSSGGQLGLSGPVNVGADGLLSGEVNLGVSDATLLAGQFASLDPMFANAIKGIGQAVAGMGKPIRFGADEIPSISVKIRRGVVKLGFIKIAKIPPFIIH